MHYAYYWQDMIWPDLTHLVADGNYTWLHYKHRKPILSSSTLIVWEKQRLPDFIRIHRSRLINPKHVTKWKLDVQEVEIGPHRLEISRRQLRAIRDQVNYLQSIN